MKIKKIDYKIEKIDTKYFLKIFIDIDEFAFSYYYNCDEKSLNNLNDLQKKLLKEALNFYQNVILNFDINYQTEIKEKNIKSEQGNNIKNINVDTNPSGQELISDIEKLIKKLNFNLEDKIRLIAKYNIKATNISELNETQLNELYYELKEISKI